MVTKNQLLNCFRVLKKKKKKTPALRGNPQKRAECIKVFTKSPKKPNSAIRKVTKVRMEFRLKRITSPEEVKEPKEFVFTEAYIPGEGHTLKQQNAVLVRGGRTPDLPGIKYRLVRGKFSFDGLATRKTSRSSYGTKKIKK
jgi:small subunit ribosomal protein S12